MVVGRERTRQFVWGLSLSSEWVMSPSKSTVNSNV